MKKNRIIKKIVLAVTALAMVMAVTVGVSAAASHTFNNSYGSLDVTCISTKGTVKFNPSSQIGIQPVGVVIKCYCTPLTGSNRIPVHLSNNKLASPGTPSVSLPYGIPTTYYSIIRTEGYGCYGNTDADSAKISGYVYLNGTYCQTI